MHGGFKLRFVLNQLQGKPSPSLSEFLDLLDSVRSLHLTLNLVERNISDTEVDAPILNKFFGDELVGYDHIVKLASGNIL